MKRWLLPVAQLIVALAVVLHALILSVVMGLPLLRDMLRGIFAGNTTGQAEVYFWATVATVVSVDIAAFVCFASGAVLLIRNPSRFGAWLSIAGAICYWVFIGSHLAMASALGPLRVELTLLDAIDFPIGIFAVLVALAIYSFEKRARHAAQ